MKILFLTAKDDVFLPLFYDKVFTDCKDEVAGLALVHDPHFYRFLNDSFRMMGPLLFFREAMGQVIHKIANLFYSIFSPAKAVSLKSVARKHGIPLLAIDKVNTRSFRDQLRESGIDLVVSTSCPQILGNKTLNTPPLGCLNVHYGLLPEYRGMYPSFWVLANGETETGVTVHYMVRQVDAGEIVAQTKVGIDDDDTFYSLVRRLKTTIGPQALLKALDGVRSGNPALIHNDPANGSYCTFPGREDMKRFLQRGKRWR